jgi:hypothetical protein
MHGFSDGFLLTLFIAIVYLLFLTGFTMHLVTEQSKLKWYQKTYLYRRALVLGKGEYLVQSFDGGKNWFEINRTADGNVIVTGPADPNLIKQLNAMHVPAQPVTEDEPINL